ncbi:hypothetical protein SteCoe_24752 [Stentor coeruleus]|uniref:Replication protein A subunit n=1 Tax=Stentor coeruleus TaxID=5963 RepID=A0A1R2BGW5_9CILI|nr:hypothetical protein SteCoe_24752 [Stentor coeruleus]
MITKGSIVKAVTYQDTKINPFIVQIYDINRMLNDVIFVEVSDEDTKIEAKLDSNLSNLLDSGAIKVNQLISVDSYKISDFEGRPVLDISSLTCNQIVPKIGTPMPISKKIQKLSEQYTPISALSTFLYDWTLKAKVIKKSELKEYLNKKLQRNEKYMSCTLLDNYNTRIQASFFSEAAEKFFQTIEEDKIYLFSGGSISLAEQKYRTPECSYQLSFNASASIIPSQDQTWKIIAVDRAVTPIEKIVNMPEKSLVDVLGIVQEVGDVVERTSKKGQALIQRVLKIFDRSRKLIEISLWNEQATDQKILSLVPQESVFHGKGLIITHYNGGVGLSTSRSLSELICNPKDESANDLLNWYKNSGNDPLVELSEKKEPRRIELQLKTVAEIQHMPAIKDEKFQVLGHVTMRKNEINLAYESCIGCKKKVNQESDGFYYCQGCRKSSKEFIHRFLLRGIIISDFTGSIFATAFHETGELILDMKVKDFVVKSEEEKQEIIKNANSKHFSFTIRINEVKTLEGNTRTEYTISNASFINHGDCTKKILNLVSNGIN